MVEPLRAKKALGQHFLVEPRYCRRIAALAGLKPHHTVVEIGAGTGRLTTRLLSIAKVIALEIDDDMIRHLRQKFEPSIAEGRLRLVQADVVHLNWRRLLKKPRTLIVGNLPYNIATRILTDLADAKERFESLTCMVQREVAERILASCGQKAYGYFSLLMAYHFNRCRGFDVPPGAFSPPPRVHSHVLQLIPRRTPATPDYGRFLKVIRSAFQKPRKTLWNNLRPNWSRTRLEGSWQSLKLDSMSRPHQLTLEQYLELARML